MRILHVVQLLYANGGIERLVLTLLKNSPFKSYVFVLQGSAEDSMKAMPILSDYKENLYFADLDLNGKLKTIRYLRRLCNNLAISAIHTHYVGPLLYTNFATLGLKNLIHIHTEHDSWHLNFRKNRFLEKVLIGSKKKLQLVAVSKQVQDGLLQHFKHKKSLLIHNGIDIEVFKPGDKEAARAKLGLPSSKTIIGSAGSLLPIKGHSYLIQALQQLSDSFHLAIAGAGPLLAELRALIQQLKLEQRVHLLGAVEEMQIFYQSCDIFCHPSLNEGLPLVLLEAQASNLPTVCTNVGGCCEALDPISGLLIEPANSRAIAEACQLIYKRKQKPREFIINHFSLEKMIDKYNLLYEGIENVNSI